MKELFKACIRIRVDALKLLFVNLLKIVFFKITLNEYFTALEFFASIVVYVFGRQFT